MKTRNATKQIMKNQPNGLSTGLAEMDRLTNGLKKGEITLIASDRGIGATSLCMSIIYKQAMEGKKVAYFSCRESEETVTRRILSIVTGLGHKLMHEENLTEDEGTTVQNAARKEMKRLRILINDMACPEVVRLEDSMVIYDSYIDSDAMFIDGLNLLKSQYPYNTRKEEVEAIMRELKSFAVMMDIPVVITCDISAAVQGRENHIPQAEDLMIYGDVIGIADNVLLLYRDEYYYPGTSRKGIMEVDYLRPASRVRESFELEFMPEYMRCMSTNHQ